MSDRPSDDGFEVEASRDVALRFQSISRRARCAADAAPKGSNASAYARVLSEAGYADVDMVEVRRLVGEW